MQGPKLSLNFLFCSSILLLTGVQIVYASYDHHSSRIHHGPKNLFVFGDSYADTGNARNPDASSWMEPYGMTFPGKPSGRFSDGRVFTDFLAQSLGLKSPLPYIRRRHRSNHWKYGMNFAYGGTGVFDTDVSYPNMTKQIDMFQELLSQSIFTPQDLRHSLAHVSLVGNDYSYYLANGGSVEEVQKFIPQVINQLVLNLQRIYNLGVKKISVTTLQPLGCLPRTTYPTLYQECNTIFNKASKFHNVLLQEAVSKLNNVTNNSALSPFVTIDFYQAFSSVIHPPKVEQRNPKFKNPLAPCCMGKNSTYYCGSTDARGKKMYTICSNPNSYFFWDSAHPTQAGWEVLSRSLQPTLQKLRY
ncbi:hypothetical protein RND81_12G035900 [Saponaria officinalis]|uniref:GDSL esterase/lipase At5g03610-like n=1 Tax=Saponaria officinalis TaxID=3572 RepID=A0AAW1H6H3_SAPOF